MSGGLFQFVCSQYKRTYSNCLLCDKPIKTSEYYYDETYIHFSCFTPLKETLNKYLYDDL